MDFKIDPDIRKAYTLPTVFYTNKTVYVQSKESLFANSWQIVGFSSDFKQDWNAKPVRLLPGCLDEPLLLIKAKEKIKAFSNVCTHRGNLLVGSPGKYKQFTCKYHGRCFNLQGQFKSMPAFEDAENFPSTEDHLSKVSSDQIGPIIFANIKTGSTFKNIYGPLLSRLDWFPFHRLIFHSDLSRTYKLDAHWALYCENYLEGFHIPFVHETLNKIISYADYQTDIYDYANVQIGISKPGEPKFEMPLGSQDFGRKIFAYYWWFFPNIMINVYTWGVSLNVVRPVGFQKTEIDFFTFLLPESDPDQFQNTALHLTEMEDEAIVMNVQDGIRSRFYNRGRFSPSMEKGVHHFQSLVGSHIKK